MKFLLICMLMSSSISLSLSLSLSSSLACSMASMGPYLDGEAIEYIAFLKEAYKYRLHSLLWNNQDRVASYAASTRYS